MALLEKEKQKAIKELEEAKSAKLKKAQTKIDAMNKNWDKFCKTLDVDDWEAA